VCKITHSAQPTIWSVMPNELIVRIFEFLDATSLIKVAQACLAWRNLLYYERLWSGDQFTKLVAPFDLVSSTVCLNAYFHS
jgi:hypothetical protein